MCTQYSTKEAHAVATKKDETIGFSLAYDWAIAHNFTLYTLLDDVGAREFAELCCIADTPLDRVLQFPANDHKTALIKLAEAAGMTVELFCELNYKWMFRNYEIMEI